jgi:hypothetical protein
MQYVTETFYTTQIALGGSDCETIGEAVERLRLSFVVSEVVCGLRTLKRCGAIP